VLIDAYELLDGDEGEWVMEEIERCLMLFTPGFIRALVSMYEEYNSGFTLSLAGPPNEEFGSILWDGDLTINLRYSDNPDINGVNAATLGHELGHAIHFIVEEIVGEETIRDSFVSMNGDFSYAGDRYHILWNPEIHTAAFAYNYGMSDVYEDVATIFELLASEPEQMRVRLSDPAYGTLRQKIEYVRYLTLYVYDGEIALFAPLETEEEAEAA
jgi:hypothetical protein